MIDKQIIIDADRNRICAAFIEDGRVAEFYMDSSTNTTLVGNIYRGRVQNILLGMSAAFIDIGEKRNAFLNLGEIDNPSFEFDGDNVNVEPNKRGLINGVALKTGQELMVQVVKDPYGCKGARVSTNIGLPGRTVVYMPSVDFVGVSRKIRDEEERRRLKRILDSLRPSGEGLIARTVAAECDEEYIKSDFAALSMKWDTIQRAFMGAKAPKMLYSDTSLMGRILRDLMKPDVRRLIINNKEQYNKLLLSAKCMEEGTAERIEFNDDSNLLETYGINMQLKDALSRRVWLKNGGYIVIDQTEALVSIDVNTGKNTGNLFPKRMIFETNCEAATVIAQQIRLRDLSGIIIIDFIDMEEQADKETVLSVLKEALKADGARTIVYGMTKLGLVEMARKKLRKSLSERLQTVCPCCCGNGRILTAETAALRLYDELSRRCSNGARSITVTAAPSVIAAIQKLLPCDGMDEGTGVLWRASPSLNVEKYIIKVDEAE